MYRHMPTAVLLVVLAVPHAAASDVEIRKSTVTARIIRSPGTDRSPAQRATGRLETLREGLNTSGEQFLLPMYEVDQGGALTTLFAVRNIFESPNPITASYFDRFGNPILTESITIPPFGVASRNLRDVVGLPAEGDGVKRGFVVLTGSDFMSGDFMAVDPFNNFATGDRLINTTEPYLCDWWDFRFLRGGGFSGGTDMVIVVNSPLGSDSNVDPTSVEIDVFDEQGNYFGAAAIWTSLVVTRVSAAEILQAVGNPAVNFGVFDIFFSSGTGGGLVLGRYSANDRYSIGMHANCV